MQIFKSAEANWKHTTVKPKNRILIFYLFHSLFVYCNSEYLLADLIFCVLYSNVLNVVNQLHWNIDFTKCVEFVPYCIKMWKMFWLISILYRICWKCRKGCIFLEYCIYCTYHAIEFLWNCCKHLVKFVKIYILNSPFVIIYGTAVEFI